MDYSFFIGVDISKLSVDAALCFADGTPCAGTGHFSNDDDGLTALLAWASERGATTDTMLICAEHTGIYERPLRDFCERRNLRLCLDSPLRIKRSMGLVRGKNDRVDAIRIAMYAFEHRGSLCLCPRPDPDIEAISSLLRERRLYVQQLSALRAARTELGSVDPSGAERRRDAVISGLQRAIGSIEGQLRREIGRNSGIKRNYDLITSVVGIGMITAAETLVYTDNFRNFRTPRQYASFIGVAPFEHSSGTSVKGRTTVSSLCRKQPKTSITMAARTAILNDPWLGAYYHRKMKEKGNLRSQHGVVLNAVKFKLVLRMFSVVRSGVPYRVL